MSYDENRISDQIEGGLIAQQRIYFVMDVIDILKAELRLLEKKEAIKVFDDSTIPGKVRNKRIQYKLSAQKMTIRKMMRKISKL
jgi:hypothetical protein